MSADSRGCLCTLRCAELHADASALLYLLGTAAFVPGGLLLHPALAHDHEAVALYIAGSALLTAAALLDALPVVRCRSRGHGRLLDMALLCLLGAGLCFLAASVALWPTYAPAGTIVGRWVPRRADPHVACELRAGFMDLKYRRTV